MQVGTVGITFLWYVLAVICFALGFVTTPKIQLNWISGGLMFLTLSLIIR